MRELLGDSAPDITYIGPPPTLALGDHLQKQLYQNQVISQLPSAGIGDLRTFMKQQSGLLSLSESQVEGTHRALFLEGSSSELKLVPLP